MKKLDKNDMPIYLIVLALIIIFPLGVYFLVKRSLNNYRNLKTNAKVLTLCGYCGIVFLIVYFFMNYSVYVSLIDSHMSLDMYSFNFIYIYFFGLVITISTLIGGHILNKKCENIVIYTEFINIRHIKDIKLISEETLESLDVVRKTINDLIDKGYLINVRLEGDTLVSKKNFDNKKNFHYVKCKTCGNVRILDKNVVRCDFCLRRMNKKDML